MKAIKAILVLGFIAVVSFPNISQAEPIHHEIIYPSGDGPFPVVIALHTSGGFKTIKSQIPKYVDAGYAVYAPDFFKRHGITHSNRFETWTTYRKPIEKELLEIIEVIKKDPKANAKNIFAVGFSNGGYWASFLAARRHVNAGASHYGVWSWPKTSGFDGYPANYFDENSNPLLAIHGDEDTVQKPVNVYDELRIVSGKSGKFKKHIFNDAGHSWDCQPCRKDGYNAEASKVALKMTLELFEANMR